jgi:glycosyltransferase involved in cell wall biosynthesis
MPVYDERATVEAAVRTLLEAQLPVDSMELLVVDDGSTDGTREVLQQTGWDSRVRVFCHPRNKGKGAAIRSGLAEANGAITTVLDADLEYPPENLVPLLAPILAGEADAVFGTRGFQSHSAYSFWYVMGNKGVTLAANLLYNSWISDVMTCHKAIRTDLFRSLRLREDGFGIEPEIAARLLRNGTRIYEVPVVYRARSRAEGKKLTIVDGARVMATLLRCRLL